MSKTRTFNPLPFVLLPLGLVVLAVAFYALVFAVTPKPQSAESKSAPAPASRAQNAANQKDSATRTLGEGAATPAASAPSSGQADQGASNPTSPEAGATPTSTASTPAASKSGQSAATEQGTAGQASTGQAASTTPPSAATSATNTTGDNNGVSQSASAITPKFTAFTGNDGKALYVQACQSCHMAGGKGAVGAGRYPALAGNAKATSTPYVASMVLYGNGGMPGFSHYLSDEQISRIVNYVRSDLNKAKGEVKASDISPLRSKEREDLVFGESAG